MTLSWKPRCAGRKVTTDDLLWPWRVRRWYDYHCKPQVLWCDLSSQWLLSMLVSHRTAGNWWRSVAQGCWDLVISWMSRLRSFQGTLNATEGWIFWSYLHFVEQLSSICSVWSFPNWDTADFCRQNARKVLPFYVCIMYSPQCGRTYCWEGQSWFII